jgi:hypothetical protein
MAQREFSESGFIATMPGKAKGKTRPDQLPETLDEDPPESRGPADATARAMERLKILDAIADGADELRTKEDGLVIDVEEPAPEQEAEAAPEEPTEAVEPVETPPEAPRKFKLKVAGKELELTEEEVIARAQKVESADEYLRQASETVRKALAPPPPVQDEAPKVEEDDLALARALQMGSEEDAARAIHNLRNARPSVTPDEVRRIARETLSIDSVVASAEARHKDLLTDPYLGDLFRLRLQRMQKEAPETPVATAYDQIGKELSTRFSGADTTAKKLARKAAAPSVPASAGARQTSDSEDEGEESATEVIAKMAAARKQERPFH